VVLIDKESQKGIVIGSGGERLKKISTEARLDMEKQLDSKVFLKVWVKVKTGWADDVRFLKDFGLK
jgi:GTP-binding protein Era